MTSSPERDASKPSDNWKNSGSRNVPPNRPSEDRKAMATPRRNTGLPNKRGGRIGSATRRSCQASAASSAMPSAAAATTGADAQGNSTPPQLSVSNRAVTPAASSSAPSPSMRACRRSVWIVRKERSHNHIAARPSGRLAQNTHRHERLSVTHPPTTGPAMDATPHMDAM